MFFVWMRGEGCLTPLWRGVLCCRRCPQLDGVDSFFVNGMLDMTEGVQETMSFLVTTKSAESGAVPTQWMVSCKASCGSPDGPSVNHIIMTSVDQVRHA